jgi:hypothetical protein
MISNKDRSGFFGASDVPFIVGNWTTKTWHKWWLTKIGIDRNNVETVSMNAGTHKEHQILDIISPFIEKDKQILIEWLRLRVNLDGNVVKHIYEVKTRKEEQGWKVPKKYIEQVNVQMYAFDTYDADLVVYELTEKDYKNYFLPIDMARLNYYPVKRDDAWLESVFLPRIEYLADCLEKGVYPDVNKFKKEKKDDKGQTN